MRRFWSAAIYALALASCRIEQTPQQYIDRQDTPADQLAITQAALIQRLESMTAAFEHRRISEIEATLMPHADAFVFAPGSDQGLTGPAEIPAALDRVANGRSLPPRQLSVSVGPRNNIAWFHVEFGPGDDSRSGEGLRFSGVFRRVEGEWRLIQGHISEALSPGPAAVPEEVEGDG